MAQWSVRMRVEKIEIWTVEADSEEEAGRRADDCATVDEKVIDLVNWEVLGIVEDK